MTLGLPDRIESKISPEPNSGCWLWEAGASQGYGYVWLNGTMVRAHVLVYETLRGPVPEGLELDHLCRVRCCVNPDHLEPVTRQINLLRGVGITALNAAKTHCPKGHSLSDAYQRYDNKRMCRPCQQERSRLRYHARKGRL